METGFDRIANKAQREPSFRFNSLTHHLTDGLLRESLMSISSGSAVGVDFEDMIEARDTYKFWSKEMIKKVHHKGYNAPPVRRVYIPKPGKAEKRPIGIPTVRDRALQIATTKVLEQIFEQDFHRHSFGGRPRRSAHQALCTINEQIAGGLTGWVLECDLKNFFGSINHDWMMKFVSQRVEDPRILSLIKRWLRAGVMEGGTLKHPDTGTPQGGPISVLLSNIYLHYVLDIWLEKVVKPKLRGTLSFVRYLDDFVLNFQYREDALRVKKALKLRLLKFGLEFEPNKTKLVEFGRFSSKWAKHRGRKPETIYFLGFTIYCTRNKRGGYKIGYKTESKRFTRSLTKLKLLMRKIRHESIESQSKKINKLLRGHYNYYGIGGNSQALKNLQYQAVLYWRKCLSSRSQRGRVNWEKFNKILKANPLQSPKLVLPYTEMKALAVL